MLLLLILVGAIALAVGLAVGMVVGVRIPYRTRKALFDCVHIWGKWSRVTTAGGEETWGQKRMCEVCGYSQWKSYQKSLAR